MKATEQYFPMVLFIVLYKVVLTFASQDKILKYDIQVKATKQYFPVLCIILYKATQTFESVDHALRRDHLNENYWEVPLVIDTRICRAFVNFLLNLQQPWRVII